MGLSTTISDPTNQTQFIVSNLGLTYVHKTIYVTAIEWRQVYSIDVDHSEGRKKQIKITIWYKKVKEGRMGKREKL